MQIKFPQEKKQEITIKEFFLEFRWIILACVALVFLIPGVLYYTSAPRSKLGKDLNYIQSILKKIEKGQEVNYSVVEEFLYEHPELRPEFDHHIVQNYLIHREVDSALPVYEKIRNRVTYMPTIYDEYSQASLMIAEDDFEGAYEKSVEIKGLLDKEKHPALYLYNMTRIAFLESMIDQKESSEKSYSEVADLILSMDEPFSMELRREIQSLLPPHLLKR